MHDQKRDSSAGTQPRVIYHWRTPRTVLVGTVRHDDHEPEPGEIPIPSLHLRGMWLATAGIEPGARLTVQVAPGCVLLRTLKPTVRRACRRAGWYA
ncbi:SymE family type I addiction module toxin [Stenotrophomonas sp. VV52]|uniref:SymE family type I addiction module toxin n=1 Tax=Stenotrophomonas sp. VV52 TaxID=2066958 RepID=UPI000C9E18C9|nr:SymE family type I addiction module toxin [Stenotrophomonas sp. VV52]